MKKVLSITWYLLLSLISVVVVIPALYIISGIGLILLIIIYPVLKLIEWIANLYLNKDWIKHKLSLIAYWRLLTGYYKKSDDDWKERFISNAKKDIERSKGKKTRPIDHYEGFLVNQVLKSIGNNTDRL